MSILAYAMKAGLTSDELETEIYLAAAMVGSQRLDASGLENNIVKFVGQDEKSKIEVRVRRVK